MELSKGTIKGLGALTLVVVLAASGFFVVKPQVEAAFALQSDTKEAKQTTEIREIRLAKLEKENSNIDSLSDEVDNFLQRIKSSKEVTDIAGAVVRAIPAGVELLSFSHGEIDTAQPGFTAPGASLTPLKPPFELVQPEAMTPKADDKEDAAVTPEATPALAGAPFVLTVSATSFETLTSFIDAMQNQQRLLNVVGVVSTIGGESASATIYAYAYTGSNSQIEQWENPAPAEDSE